MTLSLVPHPSASFGDSRQPGGRSGASRVSFVIGRQQGTVEITVSADLDALGSDHVMARHRSLAASTRSDGNEASRPDSGALTSHLSLRLGHGARTLGPT
jgi:hypothetical protein